MRPKRTIHRPLEGEGVQLPPSTIPPARARRSRRDLHLPNGSQALLFAVRGKHHWWTENMVVHSADVSGPFIGEAGFAVYFEYETTFKPTGLRSTMKEMAKYTVADGKIVKEEFFYAPKA